MPVVSHGNAGTRPEMTAIGLELRLVFFTRWFDHIAPPIWKQAHVLARFDRILSFSDQRRADPFDRHWALGALQ